MIFYSRKKGGPSLNFPLEDFVEDKESPITIIVCCIIGFLLVLGVVVSIVLSV